MIRQRNSKASHPTAWRCITLATVSAIALGLFPVETAVAQVTGCVDGQICTSDADCGTGSCDAANRACVCKCSPPGDDCFTTLCNGNTFVDFAANTIPNDFFFLGSPPFSGVVDLGGASGFTDTTVKRLEKMCFSGGFPETVGPIPVEVTQLDLKSCNCVDVGGVLFDMYVQLDPNNPSVGDLTATKEDAKGGTFTSNLNVNVEIWFEPCGGGRPTGSIFRFVPLSTSGPQHWLQDDPGTFCGASGFFPGWNLNPDTGGACCEEVCHQGPTPDHPHCVQPPKCPKCPPPTGGDPCPPPDPTNDPCANLAPTQCVIDPLTDEECRPTAYQGGIAGGAAKQDLPIAGSAA